MGLQFPKVSRTDASVAFVNIRNVSAAAISAGIPVELDVVVATDGNAVTAAKSTSKAGLFLGVNHSALADSAYGIAQVYGYRASAWVSRASAGDTPGQFLLPGAGVFDSGQTMSAATTSGHQYVTLMNTIAASAAYSSAAQLYQEPVFIRAL